MCAYYARYGVEIKSFVLSCLVTQLTLEFIHRVYCKSLFIQLAPRIHHPPTEKSIAPRSRVGEGAQLKPTSRSQFVSYSLYPSSLVLFPSSFRTIVYQYCFLFSQNLICFTSVITLIHSGSCLLFLGLFIQGWINH